MYIVYKTTNLISGKIYIGVHGAKTLNDNYLGSGILIKKAVKKYGRKNFVRETLFLFEDELDAYKKEEELVDIAFISRSDTYNSCIGGINSGKRFERGIMLCKDEQGNVHRVTKDDERYKSGEIKHIGSKKGLIRLINTITNKHIEVDIGIGKELTQRGEYVYWSKGFNHYIDKTTGKSYWIKTADPIIKELNLQVWSAGKVVVRDANGKTFSVEIDEYHNRQDIESISINMVAVKTADGQYLRVSLDDPRYLSGELVGVNKGKKGLSTHLNNVKKTCEHCSKQVSLANYKRWHGPICKHAL